MKLAEAHERAQRLSPGSRKAAARMYNDVESELALGRYTEDEADQGERALTHLERTFPDVRHNARDITTPPSLSRSAKHNLDNPAPLHARPREHAAPAGRSVRHRVASATAVHASRRRSSGRAGRLFGQTGIPGAGESASQLLMRTLGGIAGLAFLYLLTTPRGSKAVGLTSSGLTGALRTLASPTVDPLRPSATAPLTPAQQRAGQAPGLAFQHTLNSIAAGVAAASKVHAQAQAAAGHVKVGGKEMVSP